jgi:flagellar motor switch protein FliG
MPTAQRSDALTGVEKAAVLLIALGRDKSAEVLAHLGSEEVQLLSQAMSQIPYVAAKMRNAVIKEVSDLVGGDDYSEGGADYVRGLLEKALGPQKAARVMESMSPEQRARPLESLAEATTDQLVAALRGEHPQTAALVLCHLPAEKAAAVLGSLPAPQQGEIAARIAVIDHAVPEVAEQLEKALHSRLSAGAAATRVTGGAKALVEMLNNADRTTERTVLEALAERKPDLADDIRKMMFVFEDLATLDGRAIQRVLREVENDDLRVALKGAGDDIKQLVFQNVSERAAQSLKEDLELTGPVRVRDVEAAQQRMVAVVRRLEHAGDVVLKSGEEERLVE